MAGPHVGGSAAQKMWQLDTPLCSTMNGTSLVRDTCFINKESLQFHVGVRYSEVPVRQWRCFNQNELPHCLVEYIQVTPVSN